MTCTSQPNIRNHFLFNAKLTFGNNICPIGDILNIMPSDSWWP